MNDSKILGYQPGNSFIHALNATTKMIFLIWFQLRAWLLTIPAF